MKCFVLAAALALGCFFTHSPVMAQQKAGKNIRINHVALYVTNLAKSTTFYKEVVGLDTIPEPFHDGKHTWFSIGDKAHLHLIEGRHQPTEGEKNTHLCFSTGNLDALITTLTSRKIAYENWAGQTGSVTKRVDGIRQIWFRDPDGYWIEANDDFQP
ncbi:VOC family protein [Flavihumibacter petaseus]|uniref:VOC domain-containing protein n=1 Tax=Flavihumibacter petaseus NBRC 106054 TaxID=1220578 RepID=A0A0E9MXV9_9BACT|nr:VOC family protein [Flavihumibacter petaseus]GAO41960.1 hypothetical protein FPE01S_01_09730 [Flavihumibacter petaseus NBRC 106054]